MSLFSCVSAEMNNYTLNLLQIDIDYIQDLFVENNIQVTAVESNGSVFFSGDLFAINHVHCVLLDLKTNKFIDSEPLAKDLRLNNKSPTSKDSESCNSTHVPVTLQVSPTHNDKKVNESLSLDNIHNEESCRNITVSESGPIVSDEDTNDLDPSEFASLIKPRTDFVADETGLHENHETCVAKHKKSKTPVKCCKCTKTFLSIKCLKRHEDTHVTVKVKRKIAKYKPNKTKKKRVVSKTKSTLKSTDKQKLLNSVLCGLCDKSFSDKDKLKEHIKTCHFDLNESTNYTISEVDDTIKKEINEFGGDNNDVDISVDEYKYLPSPTKSVNCRYCTYVGKTISSTKTHEYRCYAIYHRRFVCQFCDKPFGFKKDLKRHLISHDSQRFKCPFCERRYRHEKHMLDHAKCHDESYVTPQHVCEYCNKTYCSIPVLKLHIKRLHLGQRTTYLCQTCGKEFLQKRSYHMHLNVHLGVKPYVCEICGSSFAYDKSLNEHMLRHGDARKYECTVCHKRFKQMSGLYIHMKIHKPTRDYVCSYCQRGFSQKSSLVRHERIHLGTKPYSCNICREIFRDVSVIRRHLIMVHKANPKSWKDAMTRALSTDINKYFVEPKVVPPAEPADVGMILLDNYVVPDCPDNFLTDPTQPIISE